MKKIMMFLLLSIPLFAIAQTKESYSSWNSLIVDYHLYDNFYLKNEAHFRRTDFLSNWQQILIRPSLHYKYNETVDFGIGYTYSRNYSTSLNFNENDVWEQVMLLHRSNKSSFKHRFRFEERLIDRVLLMSNNTYAEVGTDFKMRFRYRFTWGMPLIKVEEGRYIGITAFDEIWLNTEKGIVPRSINQNWFYTGLSYPISKTASIGMGYMDAYAPNGNNGFSNNHILQATLKYHI